MLRCMAVCCSPLMEIESWTRDTYTGAMLHFAPLAARARRVRGAEMAEEDEEDEEKEEKKKEEVEQKRRGLHAYI